MALPAGRCPGADGASQVRRYHPPSGCGARSRAAMSDSPGRTRPVCRLGRTESQGGGDGEGMLRRPAEEGAARLGPLQEQVAVVLPRVADAAEGLDRLAAHEALTVVTGGLGHGDRRGAGGRVLVDGGDGEVAQGAGALEGEEHVAHLVLDRLE